MRAHTQRPLRSRFARNDLSRRRLCLAAPWDTGPHYHEPATASRRPAAGPVFTTGGRSRRWRCPCRSGPRVLSEPPNRRMLRPRNQSSRRRRPARPRCHRRNGQPLAARRAARRKIPAFAVFRPPAEVPSGRRYACRSPRLTPFRHEAPLQRRGVVSKAVDPAMRMSSLAPPRSGPRLAAGSSRCAGGAPEKQVVPAPPPGRCCQSRPPTGRCRCREQTH